MYPRYIILKQYHSTQFESKSPAMHSQPIQTRFNFFPKCTYVSSTEQKDGDV